jgi:hypothetical protein
MGVIPSLSYVIIDFAGGCCAHVSQLLITLMMSGTRAQLEFLTSGADIYSVRSYVTRSILSYACASDADQECCGGSI